MPQRVETSEFYHQVNLEEEILITNIVGLVLNVVKNREWHGAIAVVGGRLNRTGKRKDTDIKVIISNYSYSNALTHAVESEVTGQNRFVYKRLIDGYNGKVILYILNPDNLEMTPIHLILPSHGIGSNSLESRWPWDRRKKYAILAEF